MAKFCVNCGEKLNEKDEFCSKCGKSVKENSNTTRVEVVSDPNAKSKLGAGLLAIFVGALGVHNFYLGYNGKAVAQLLLTLVGWILCGLGPIAAVIWSFIEGIMILAGSIDKDADGNPLKD